MGNWEADTFIGKNHHHAIVRLVERKSGLKLMRKIERKTAQAVVGDTMIHLLKPHRKKCPDNRKEFARHETITKKLKVGFYFAHPYAPWDAWHQ
jgi:IS30 family transposase